MTGTPKNLKAWALGYVVFEVVDTVDDTTTRRRFAFYSDAIFAAKLSAAAGATYVECNGWNIWHWLLDPQRVGTQWRCFWLRMGEATR